MSTSSNSRETPEKIHEFVCDLARRAAELQLSRYEKPGTIHEKAPKDVVTEVDLLCEELMVSAIEERYPEDSILSEEQGGKISETGRSWLLDPVDGTANFSKANPLFCACISVIEDGTVTHAAVAVPRLGDLYHARLGGGTYRETGGERVKLAVSDTKKLEYAFVGADMILSRKKRNRRSGVQEVFDSCWQIRALGSAGVRGAWTSAGYIDVSLGTNNTAWDYAPTALLVSEAGGESTDLSGKPWTPSSDGLLATNGVLHEEVLEILTRV
ncbi:MAG: inositol monophosphatase [Actinomycetota bacterium]|nr:inositol monophosphatase [Actinomycetota bacterium]HZY66288.1 inositol monophosphatase [Rubrobacteraceae bacterium]